MPRIKSEHPTTAFKCYLNEANTASMVLVAFDADKARFRFGTVSQIINDALAEYFSPEHKEFLEWKAKKQSSDSAS